MIANNHHLIAFLYPYDQHTEMRRQWISLERGQTPQCVKIASSLGDWRWQTCELSIGYPDKNAAQSKKWKTKISKKCDCLRLFHLFQISPVLATERVEVSKFVLICLCVIMMRTQWMLPRMCSKRQHNKRRGSPAEDHTSKRVIAESIRGYSPKVSTRSIIQENHPWVSVGSIYQEYHVPGERKRRCLACFLANPNLIQILNAAILHLTSDDVKVVKNYFQTDGKRKK